MMSGKLNRVNHYEKIDFNDFWWKFYFKEINSYYDFP